MTEAFFWVRIEQTTQEVCQMPIINKTRLMSADMCAALIGQLGLLSLVERRITEGDDNAGILKLRLGGNGEFNFIQDSEIGNANLAYVDRLISECADYVDRLVAFKNQVVAYCNYTQEISQLQYNRQNNIYKSKIIDWPNTAQLKLSFNAPEKCPVTLWVISDDYDEPQNLGRAAYGTTKTVHKIGDLKSQYPDAKLEIRVPFESVIIEVA